MRVNKISAVKKEFFFNSFEFNFDSTNIYIYIYINHITFITKRIKIHPSIGYA